MTVTIEIPTAPGEVLRALIPLVEPVALAIAAACGAGVLTQIAIDAALRLARHALSA
jgi:hypothetical protein